MSIVCAPFKRISATSDMKKNFNTWATKRFSKVCQAEAWKYYIFQKREKNSNSWIMAFQIGVLWPTEQSIIFGFDARRLAQFTDLSGLWTVCVCLCVCGIRRLRDMLWKQVLFISQEGGWVVWGLWLLSWSTATGKLKSFQLYLA